MNNKSKSTHDNGKNDLFRYAGLATQILAYLSLSIFAGMKLDRWLHIFPWLSALFPLLVLIALFYQLFKETGGSHKS